MNIDPPTDRKKSPSYHEIMVCMLDPNDGVDGVRQMKPRPSRHTLLRSAIALRRRKHEKEAQLLGALTRDMFPSASAPDRKPQVGTRRRYKVWIQDGTLYSRIPVATLGVRKGDSVEVEYLVGKTVITPH